MHYTRGQIDDMKSRCDLVELSRWCGYTPIRKGRTYSLKEHDSVRIFNHRTFTQYSSGVGGDAIVFLQHFMACSFQEAAEKLGDFTGGIIVDQEDKKQQMPPVSEEKNKEFVLPDPAANYKRLYAYLIKTRCIDKTIVDYCVKNHLIYESAAHHNIVFLSRDKEGECHHAFMRGTNEAYPYKGDVEGNDKRYGFNISAHGEEVRVFESAIDALSEWTITKDSSVSRLALGGVHDAPLTTYLAEHPEIKKIEFCLDNDPAGNAAIELLMKKYQVAGYQVTRRLPCFPDGIEGKDYNDLCKILQQESMEKRPRRTVSKHAVR